MFISAVRKTQSTFKNYSDKVYTIAKIVNYYYFCDVILFFSATINKYAQQRKVWHSVEFSFQYYVYIAVI